jgi:hypothetical protein
MRGLTKWYPQLKELTPNQCNVDRSVNIRGKKINKPDRIVCGI